jgi:hypothetical protein
MPILESDLSPERSPDPSGNRWSKAEWSHFELWEKVEQRLRRRRLLWVAAAVVAFLLLSAVPAVLELLPRWRAQGAAHLLAREIGWMKRQASVEGRAYRIGVDDDGGFRVESAPSCQAGDGDWAAARSPPERGGELGAPGLVRGVCYDPRSGAASSSGPLAAESLFAFAIAPVRDLAEGRLDRASVLVVRGPSAEISMD